MVPAGSLLIGCIGTIGKLGITTEASCSNQQITAIIPKNSVDVNYLYYWFQANQAEVAAYANNAVVPILNNRTLGTIKIPVFPLPTQRRIAAALDLADRQRQLLRAEIAAYGELGESLFLEMFGDPVSNSMKFPLQKLSRISKQVTDGTHHSPEPQEKGRPYVTAKHVKAYGLDFMAKPTFIAEEAHEEIIKRCNPMKGDVLYIKDGATTGIACVNTFEESISLLSSLALIKPDKDKLNENYLVALLNNHNMQLNLQDRYMSGAAIKRYTIAKIKKFDIPLPPVVLQNRFATRIRKIEALKAQVEIALAEADDLFNTLLQRAFRGELFAEEAVANP